MISLPIQGVDDPRQVKDIIHVLDGGPQRFFIPAIPDHQADIQPLEFPGPARFADQAMDLIAAARQLFDEMAADESAASRDQGFHSLRFRSGFIHDFPILPKTKEREQGG